MTFFFDTSAFAASAFKDLGYERIDAWVEATDAELAFSSWTSGEFAVAVSRQVRATGLDDQIGYALIARADTYLGTWVKLVIEGEDVETAASWVRNIDLSLSLPDALHIAIARRTGARLVTTDRQQFAAAKILGVTCFDPVRQPIEETP